MVTVRNRYCVFIAALATAVMLGCARAPQQSPATAPEAVGAQKPALTDEQILAEVKKLFAADPELTREKIEITVKDRRVTLAGHVSSGEVRIKAEDKARAHPEVFGVDAEKLLVQ